ncbi:MAG TPA: hypothetical protein PLN53_09920 [Terricaulis sp.]|nr:hypothetical protein [Terricaulis sp.]
MTKFTAFRVESLRRRGLVERAANGMECVRVTLHPKRPANAASYALLKTIVNAWAGDMRRQVNRFGAQVLDETISVSGQSVEALAPIAKLAQLSSAMEKSGVEVDLVRPERATF